MKEINEELIKEKIVAEIEEENYEEEIEQDNESTEMDENNRNIIWQPKDITIREFLSMKQDGDLILQPDYQRNFVMNQKQSSRLIESILMDVPLPVIYLNEEKDGRYSVIDGQQRLTSFLTFIEEKVFGTNKQFKLVGLNILKELNGKAFSQLEKESQNKIKTTTLHTIIIKKESNEDIKFEIFERLNTGSIKLNEDEIRNTVYRGKYMDLLSELEDNEIFHKLVRKDNYKNRMIYRGMILRFFALYEKSYLNYKPSIKQFSNKHLREFRNLSDEKIKEYREVFKNTTELVYSIFGENAFRRYIPGDNDNINGYWALTRINMAIYDIQMCCFAKYTKNQIIQKVDIIREEFIKLMCNNQKFIDCILNQTSNKEQLQTRFKIWFEKLEEIIGLPKEENRIFPYNIKKSLFELDKTCKICGQQISSIDDSEVDHIIPFSKGGKTDINNAQLAHRYCNRQKNNNI
ncbi:DUF262 domain-containing protein [Candidatus Gracilibacteria bacterium]|nr:DUF262 domain-containing protein [Candidatus Gracilibacteria bacterium]